MKILDFYLKLKLKSKCIGLDTDFHDPVLNFPSVTVCPLEPYDINKVNITTEYYFGEAYDVSWVLLENVTRLSYDNLKEFSDLYEKNKKISLDWNLKSLREWAFLVAVGIDEVFDSCQFRGEFKDCKEIFRPIYSERGFCFGLNSRYYGEFE